MLGGAEHPPAVREHPAPSHPLPWTHHRPLLSLLPPYPGDTVCALQEESWHQVTRDGQRDPIPTASPPRLLGTCRPHWGALQPLIPSTSRARTPQPHLSGPSKPRFHPHKVKARQQDALTGFPLGPADPSIPAGPWGEAKAMGGLGCCSLPRSADQTSAHRNPAQGPRSCLSHYKGSRPHQLTLAPCPCNTDLVHSHPPMGPQRPSGTRISHSLQGTWGANPTAPSLLRKPMEVPIA